MNFFQNQNAQGLVNQNKIVYIPTYQPDGFEDLFFESRFYCIPGYENWAKVCFYTGILRDNTVYNKKDDKFVFEDARLMQSSKLIF